MNNQSSANLVTPTLLQFHRMLNRKCFADGEVVWRKTGISTLMTSPASNPYDLGRSEIRKVLRKSRSLVAQFATKVPTGVTCKHHVLYDRDYSESSLQRQFRQTLQRARKQLTFRMLTFEEIATRGIGVIESKRTQNGTIKALNPTLWNESWQPSPSLKFITPFGCFEGDRLVGLSVFCDFQGTFRPVVHAVRPEALSLGASNLLVFESLRHLIQQPNCQCVSLGRSGIPDLPSVNRFKRHAGLSEEPIHVAAILHPLGQLLLRCIRAKKLLPSTLPDSNNSSRFRQQVAGLCVANATDPSLLAP